MAAGNFVKRFTAGHPAARVAADLLDAVSDASISMEYRIVSHSDEHISLRHDFRPWWVWVLCVVLFPIGLIALTVKRTSEVAITLRALEPQLTEVTVTGPRVRYIERFFDESRERLKAA